MSLCWNSPLKGILMTISGEAVLEAATEALSKRADAHSTAGALGSRREDARAVVVAVLVALGGAKGRQGLLPFRTSLSQTLLGMADELEAEGT